MGKKQSSTPSLGIERSVAEEMLDVLADAHRLAHIANMASGGDDLDLLDRRTMDRLASTLQSRIDRVAKWIDANTDHATMPPVPPVQP